MVAASEAERTLPKISSSLNEDEHLKENGEDSLCNAKNGVVPSKDGALQSSYFKTEPVWINVAAFVLVHIYLVYATYLYGKELSWKVGLTAYGMTVLSGLGVTVGSHRLWAHRCFKARLPTRIVLMLLQTSAGQNSIYIWCRDHRMHHKYTETDADPHTTTRGMFFAHMGWLMVRKHPDVIRQGKNLDCSDLMADPVVRFQYYFFMPMAFILVGLVPFFVFYKVLGCSLGCAYYVSTLRYLVLLHGTWCVNSLAHWLGDKPYDKDIRPTENTLTSFLTSGEGFHNYHHVFPFDYKAAELKYSPLNLSTTVINALAAIGQIYDLKEASEEMILKRKARTGDGHIY